ncbi:succinyl-diaminopimelate desuccinylase [Actinomyces capricornis]|uniref:Succinyl-diaminopimelate desuccinylase n=1 Tax=Actinomyces capricornis TaxID=2755559 RepID=A0ABN6K608_9ACTO|nr:succinyl-diaminopimelate desuccinylase [Actinomyces capricornis]BDA65020.1 succinyl-diaminopimelate desuccinylase [Actinomyces capricornis]
MSAPIPASPHPSPLALRLPSLSGPDAATPAQIALALVDAFSVSGCEGPLADAVQEALEALPHLQVLRHGNTVVARTSLGRPERVVIAGHLDTVPVSHHTGNVPGRLEEREGQEVIWGRGSVDMKGGVAVLLHLAATLSSPSRDATWVFYDNEEVTSDLNGLGRVLRERPEWLEADFAVLAEPTGAQIEGGCNGTLRLILTVHGLAAHSGRSWRGVNAVHAAAPLIERAATAPVREVEVEGLVYREGFSVVDIAAGIAMNTIPDRCRLSVNYRFAPDLSAQEALDRALRILAGLPADGDEHAPVITAGSGEVEVVVDDLSPAARPGLETPMAAELIEAVRARGGDVGPKYGWTDVARFSAAGIPAINLGPGDPMLCHTDDEHCPVNQIEDVAAILRTWLS